MKYECDCGWAGTPGDMDPIKDVEERVSMGELMAAGCCPKCGDMFGVDDTDVPNYTIEACIRIARERKML